jgi:hypothetical protein
VTEPEAAAAESGAGAAAGPSADTLYSALTDTRRRYVLHYLKQQDDAVSVRDLAEQVAAWENDTTVENLTSQERKRVYVSLYQSHLSTLDDAGVVDYDKEAGTVDLAERIREVDLFMEVVGGSDIPWRRFYLGLVAVNAVLLGLVWLDLRPFTMLSDFQWAIVVLGQFAVSALVEAVRSRRMRLGDPGPPPEYDAG